jgi:hypothetical protein
MIALAQFPLQIVVFADEIIPLHIFEPRYRQLIADCKSENAAFGITPVIDGSLQDCGTRLVLTSIDKSHEDGRLDITAQATGTYQINKFYASLPGKLYGGAEVTFWEAEGQADTKIAQQITTLMQELHLHLLTPIDKISTEFNIQQVAHKIGFSLKEEYNLLITRNVVDRQKLILAQLERILPGIREMEEIKRRIELNGDWRHIITPKF